VVINANFLSFEHMANLVSILVWFLVNPKWSTGLFKFRRWRVMLPQRGNNRLSFFT